MKHNKFYVRPYVKNWNNPESDSLHLEYSYDKETWYNLNGNNGILFAKGGSGRMTEPQIIKVAEDKFKVYAKDALDSSKTFVYETSDLINYSDEKIEDTAKIEGYTAPNDIIEISKELLDKLNSVFGKPEPVVIESVEQVTVEVKAGEPAELPKKVMVTYSNGMKEEKNASWEAVDTAIAGTKTVKGTVSERFYLNPLIYHRADPCIYKHTDGNYYFVASYTDDEHNLVGEYQYRYILLRKASSLEDLADNSGKYEERCVFTKDPVAGNNSPHIWAPEIHFINGDFYIYFTTCIDDNDCWSIRPHVMRCQGDPMKDEWEVIGRVQTTTTDSIAFTEFSLDHTVLQHKGELYFFWAEKHPKVVGANVGGDYDENAVQVNSDIYLAKMVNPWTIDSSRICKVVEPEYNWELHGFPVCEGPAVLVRNGKVFMAYSASGTDALYCMGMCTADADADLLDPKSWTKSPYPVFQSSRVTGQYGPGHNSFTYDDEGNDIIVYHARQEERYLVDPGYQPLYDAGRNACLSRVYWNPDGTPNFSVPFPSGEPREVKTEFTATVVVK